MELNLTIPTTLHSPSYLFWKARYGTCRSFVYTLLLDDNFDSKYVLYLVRKVFSRRIQRRRLRGMGPSILQENRQLSDRPLSDQINNIATPTCLHIGGPYRGKVTTSVDLQASPSIIIICALAA